MACKKFEEPTTNVRPCDLRLLELDVAQRVRHEVDLGGREVRRSERCLHEAVGVSLICPHDHTETVHKRQKIKGGRTCWDSSCPLS